MTLLAISLALAAQTVPTKRPAGEDDMIQQVPVQAAPPVMVLPPAPPAPPAPTLAAKGARQVAPRGSPQDWVVSEDYPKNLLFEHATGATAFRLDVDAQGRVAQCTVTASSGHEELDVQTCALLRRRARFTPAADGSGRPIASIYANRIRWALPDSPVPARPWARVTRFVLDEAGAVRGCTVTGFDAPQLVDDDPCKKLDETPSEARAIIRGKGAGLVTITRTEEQGFPAKPRPKGYADVADPLMFARRVSYNIDATGEIGDCRVVSRTGRDIVGAAIYSCHPGLRYTVPEGRGAALPRAGTFTTRVTTTGAMPPMPEATLLLGDTDPAGPHPIDANAARSWITGEDYPPLALREVDSGVVGFLLDIDATGAVIGCHVTATSSSEVLDKATCDLLRARAQFAPARDPQKRAVPGTYAGRVRWELPLLMTPRLASWLVSSRAIIGSGGSVHGCEVSRLGTSPFGVPAFCNIVKDTKLPQQFTGLTGDATDAKPVVLVAEMGFRVEGLEPVSAGYSAPGMVARSLVSFTFDITPDGKLANCVVVDQKNTDDDSICSALYRRYDVSKLPVAARKGSGWLAVATGPFNGSLPPVSASAPVVVVPAQQIPQVNAPAPPPGMAPPPAPPSSMAPPAKPAVPIGNPAEWISSDDYPSAALRAGATGVVGFELIVDTTGAISNCRVTTPSGSDVLDLATCALLKRRARFKPARDPDGRSVAETWASRVRWTIPEEPEVPMASWLSELHFVVAANGELGSCSFKSFSAPEISDRSPCVDIAEVPVATMRQLRGASKGPVTIVVRYQHVVKGIALPAFVALPARFKRIDGWTGTFNVDANGEVGMCDGTIDDHDLPVPAVTCQSWTKYPSGGDPFTVTATIDFFTDGDANVAAVLPRLGKPED